MRATGWTTAAILAAVLATTGCSGNDAAAGDDGGGDEATEASVRHAFEPYRLGPYEEVQPCLAWTLDNDEALWVQGATLSNDGYYHHSNWTVVPEDMYPGEDGFFDCAERGFNQVEAAIAGTVLMAQSTQARHEVQRFPDGAVVKIPPRHKIVAGGHLLNTGGSAADTQMRIELQLVHPSRVRTVLTPFHLDYRALDIPPHAESRFELECDLASALEGSGQGPLDLKIRYVLPHFHYMANYWSLEVVGGPRDGEVLHLVDGFDAEANGRAFDPPVDLTGARGLKMTCGFLNDRDVSVGWGIGDQEMCEMLGLAESDLLIDASAHAGNEVLGTDAEGRVRNAAPCVVTPFPRHANQAMPTAAELEAPLYVPPSGGEDVIVDPVCVDTPPDAEARPPITLSSVREEVLVPSCSFNACHGGASPAAGLDVLAADLHGELLAHAPVSDPAVPLVAPGDPEGSLLYRRISRCEPRTESGQALAHMPLDAPTLLDPDLVAKVRDWIAAGALDD